MASPAVMFENGSKLIASLERKNMLLDIYEVSIDFYKRILVQPSFHLDPCEVVNAFCEDRK
jgi:hypothetical protein